MSWKLIDCHCFAWLIQRVFQRAYKSQKSRWLPEATGEATNRRRFTWLLRLDNASWRYRTGNWGTNIAKQQGKGAKCSNGFNGSAGWGDRWTSARTLDEETEKRFRSNKSSDAARLSKGRQVTSILLDNYFISIFKYRSISHWTSQSSSVFEWVSR